MKVVISGYVGKKITGIGRNLICLLEAGHSQNLEYIIYTNYDMKEEMYIDNKKVYIKTYPISKEKSFQNLLWTTFVFPFVTLKEKADKVLIPNFTLLLFKFKPTYVIMHDLIEFNVPDKFSSKKMFYRTKLADPITARRADHIITVSKNSKNDIEKFLHIKNSKISVIYNGVDQEKFKKVGYDDAKEIFAKNNWPMRFLLYAGTLDHPGKNVLSVIKAFELLKGEKNIEEYLILAGMHGKGYEEIDAYIQGSKYKKQIIVTGFVTDQELIALYSLCSAFCFVSLYEGFGIPPLEALSCGANVVVSNTSSLPEVVGDVGFTVPPNDIKEISAAIYRAMTCADCKEKKERVRKHLLLFNWKESAKKFENLLMEKR